MGSTGPCRPTVMFVVCQTPALANGGVESITQVIERLRTMRPLIVTQAETGATERWRKAGAEVHVWPLFRRPSDLEQHRLFPGGLPYVLALLANNWSVFRLLRVTTCEVVHCNDRPSFWSAAFGTWLSGAALVNNVRDTKTPDEVGNLTKWKLALRLADCQLVLSQEMLRFWANALEPTSRHARQRSKLVHIYSVVDSRFFRAPTDPERAAERAGLQVPDGCLAIGYVASFGPKKAQLHFIRQALPGLRASLPSAKVFFIGDFSPERDGYARSCQEEVARLGLDDSVVFVGFDRYVQRWYRALDLVVLASRTEGLARCMIESLACGTPVVSFDVCSAREILEEHECGRVVAQGDYEEMVRELVTLAHDGALRRRLGENGAAAARRLFDPDRVVAQYEALYARLAEERPERVRWPGRHLI